MLKSALSQWLPRVRFGRVPFRGQTRLADAAGKLAAWANSGAGKSSPSIGWQLETDLRDRIQRQMWAGVYEPHVRKCFEALIRPGDTYFDVGGHIGYHASLAALRTGPAGRVYAFEADPAMHAKLAANLRQFPWATAVHSAVWERSGTLEFERTSDRDESGWGTLTAVRDLRQGEHLRVAATTLDDFCAQAAHVRLDAMKIDAEGSELGILRGARATLERFRPIMVMEINQILLRQGGTTPTEIVDFLGGQDYRVYSLGWKRIERWDVRKLAPSGEALCLAESKAEAAIETLKHRGFGVRE
ncbi:MAG: FkbM family methyltransferase [Candidatus Acidiferrales bacterium]